VEAHQLQQVPGAEAAVIDAAGETARRIIDNVRRVIHAPQELLERCVLAVLCEGHVILEDFPGVGKTMLAKSLARSIEGEFARIQGTPDLLPSDITGVNVFNLQRNEFEFKPGPVFANLVLVDEINRASPKTQSALLECMQEAQVTVDGQTHPLARPFMVIATQNPIEYEGTFPLPEAQLDRFTMRLTLGYPSLQEEAKMLSEHAVEEPLETLGAVASSADVEAAIEAIKGVFVEDALNRYVVSVLRHTRSDGRLALGASPRAGISLLRVAKAHAAVRGRSYVVPADVKDVAADVLSHRVILAPEARTSGITAAEAIREAVERTPVPM
jgi:MoxR-like ATPase